MLRECLGCKDGESVLIVTDTNMETAANAFLQAADNQGLECSLISMPPRKTHGEEPTASVAAAMHNCDVAVLLTTWSLTHTVARRVASDEHGVRIASMPGVDLRRLPGLLDIDYAQMSDLCEKIAERIEGHSRIRIQSEAGSDLTFEIGKRTVYRDVADLQASGVPIQGEAGVGYHLQRGFELPPVTLFLFCNQLLYKVILRSLMSYSDSLGDSTLILM